MEKTYIVIAFIFDSGRLGDSFYGRVVFEHMLKDKEIASNTKKQSFQQAICQYIELILI